MPRMFKFMFIYAHSVGIIYISLFLCGRQNLCFHIVASPLKKGTLTFEILELRFWVFVNVAGSGMPS